MAKTAETDTDVDAPSDAKTISAVPPRSTRWVLPTIAGVGILSLGLLGGILIGQNTVHPMGPDRSPDARILVEHQQTGQGERLSEHAQEKLRERLRDVRESHKQSPNRQQPANPETPGAPMPSSPETEPQG